MSTPESQSLWQDGDGNPLDQDTSSFRPGTTWYMNWRGIDCEIVVDDMLVRYYLLLPRGHPLPQHLPGSDVIESDVESAFISIGVNDVSYFKPEKDGRLKIGGVIWEEWSPENFDGLLQTAQLRSYELTLSMIDLY